MQTARPWSNPHQSVAVIQQLLRNQLSLTYAGGRIHGEAADRDHLEGIAGIAAVWPHPATLTLDESMEASWVARVDYNHYELYTFGNPDDMAEQKRRTAYFRQIVLEAKLRPDLAPKTAGIDRLWESLNPSARTLILAAAEAEARHTEVPLAFLLFNEVSGSDQFYVQLWHNSHLPPKIALEILIHLYRQRVTKTG